MEAIIRKKEIEQLLPNIDVIAAMEEAFIAYSKGEAIVPPVGELLFDKPKGDVHIKYGYIKQQPLFVIKIASGFYENQSLGISSSQGLMLLLSSKTGQLKAVLLDNGYLTDVRTAAAGATVAKYMQPKQIKGVGIIGTGIQARLQLEYLSKVIPLKNIWVWGRNLEAAEKYAQNNKVNKPIQVAKSITEVAVNCNYIITTTPAEKPLLFAKQIQPGTHITAVGSDTAHKQELDSSILTKANLVVVDSISQSKSRGEVYQAVKQGLLNPKKVLELGHVIEQNKKLQQSNADISIADLTGVAVQDIAIATAVYNLYKNQ